MKLGTRHTKASNVTFSSTSLIRKVCVSSDWVMAFWAFDADARSCVDGFGVGSVVLSLFTPAVNS